MRLIPIAGVIAISLVTPSHGPLNGGAQTAAGQGVVNTLQREVAEQATADFTLYAGLGGTPVPPTSIRVSPGPLIGPGLQVWRADLPADHAGSYLVAVDGAGGILHGGGFSNPELARATIAVRTSLRTASDAGVLARKLAVLADPNGAVQVVFPMRHDASSVGVAVRRAWAAQSALWPEDSAISVPGGWTVLVTIASRATRTRELWWLPTIYSFRFDSTGKLDVWSQRTGASIKGAQVPLATPGDKVSPS